MSKELINPPDSLFELLRQGDSTTLAQIKESATGPLIIYIIKCIENGDTKRSDATTKLLDLIYKHSPKDEKKEAVTDYASFLEELKD
ncbi:hypothetical protein [Methylobacter sp.]|uniref:hypothetical protein n=1 Tax=Methylobacter sp. TaxID=2051955 RepID=UPI003DA5FB4F